MAILNTAGKIGCAAIALLLYHQLFHVKGFAIEGGQAAQVGIDYAMRGTATVEKPTTSFQRQSLRLLSPLLAPERDLPGSV